MFYMKVKRRNVCINAFRLNKNTKNYDYEFDTKPFKRVYYIAIKWLGGSDIRMEKKHFE